MTPTEQQKAILECRENLVVIAALDLEKHLFYPKK